MIQVSISKDNLLTNQGSLADQASADAWYADQCQNFPDGHVRTDNTIEDPELKTQAQAYLNETDWYIIRQMDIGTAVPEDVKAKREAARLTVNPPA